MGSRDVEIPLCGSDSGLTEENESKTRIRMSSVDVAAIRFGSHLFHTS